MNVKYCTYCTIPIFIFNIDILYYILSYILFFPCVYIILAFPNCRAGATGCHCGATTCQCPVPLQCHLPGDATDMPQVATTVPLPADATERISLSLKDDSVMFLWTALVKIQEIKHAI